MKLLIQPILKIDKEKKSVCEFNIVLTKKNPESLLIVAKSKKDKYPRKAGYISRNGFITTNVRYHKQLDPLFNKRMRRKIDFLLDMVYGKDRTQEPEFDKLGRVEFKKPTK